MSAAAEFDQFLKREKCVMNPTKLKQILEDANFGNASYDTVKELVEEIYRLRAIVERQAFELKRRGGQTVTVS